MGVFSAVCEELHLQLSAITQALSPTLKETLFLPARLIHVDAFQLEPCYLDVRLVGNLDVGLGSGYIVLSYCWGRQHAFCMTTPSNIRRQLERILWMWE